MEPVGLPHFEGPAQRLVTIHTNVLNSNTRSKSLKGNQSVLVLTPGFCSTDMVTKNHDPLVAPFAPKPKPA
jgi:hypothetical protein